MIRHVSVRYIAGLIAALACAFAMGGVSAHALSVAHVDIAPRTDGDDLDVEVDLALRDIALTLPMDADRDERVTWRELQRIAPSLVVLVVDRVWVARGGSECRLVPTDIATRRYDDGTYAAVSLRAQCMRDGPVQVHYALFLDRDPRHRALVTLRDGERTTTAIAHAGATTLDLPLAGGSPFLQFLREGVHHILVGHDHLAFLMALLLTATLVRSDDAWAPAPGVRDSFGRVLGIVTAFTLAHSITLSLAALGWVVPSSHWVEATIAGSVAVAALNNVRAWITRRGWVIGFAFGLVHGFGFAGALGELGLPAGARLAALAGFNVGVELGQLAVVAAVVPLLYLVRRTRWYPQLAMPAASWLIAGVAGAWMVQRVAQ